MPRSNETHPVEVELVGGPLDGRRITVPSNQYTWIESGHCYLIKADARMHYMLTGLFYPPPQGQSYE